jgi:hypothetical protein
VVVVVLLRPFFFFLLVRYSASALEERIVELHCGALSVLTHGASPAGGVSSSPSHAGLDSTTMDGSTAGGRDGTMRSVLAPRPNLPDSEIRRWDMAKRLQVLVCM